MAAYLTTSDADALAATLVGFESYLAASAGDKAKALLQASDEIDQAMRYQGRKYDPAQEREFPRAAYDSGFRVRGSGFGSDGALADVVWDFDADANEAIVPAAVEMAVLRQADYLLAGTRDELEARANSGLASQSVGGMSESYTDVSAAGGGSETRGLLCAQARALMDRYRLRTGPMR